MKNNKSDIKSTNNLKISCANNSMSVKKIIAICLIFAMCISTYALADVNNQELAAQTIKLLGIMTGDSEGNMNLSSDVTREEFAKMVIAASLYKDGVAENSSYSVFKDVKYNRWSAPYIKLAVDLKLFSGYIDGTFKPENKITTEEAATVVLRLLGYENSDFTGSYPNAQLVKYKSLGLDKNISKIQGQYMTRKDCMNLFYNLMNAKAKNGSVYAVTLGYSLSSNGEIDYNALLKKELSGPYVVSGSNLESVLPFSLDSALVYRDGTISNASSIANYDVVYYSPNLKSIWAYSKKIIGTYTAAAPNISAPSSVTVAGNSYALSSSLAVHKMSATGEFSIGDTVVLLLDMNGEAADVVTAANVENTYCGVVISSNKIVADDGSVKSEITVACTDGTTKKYDYSGSVSVGNIVTIEYTKANMQIKRVSDKNVNLSNYKLAENVEIIDVNQYGEYLKIYPGRIKNVTLNEDNIRYYTLNSSGQVDKLILNDVTGDLSTYGIVTGVEEIDKSSENAIVLQGVYKYIIDGKSSVLTTQNSIFNIKTGPAMFNYENGSIKSIRSLAEANISTVGETFVMSNNQKYMLADDVQVYLYKDYEYYLTELSNVSDLDTYTLRAYIDSNYKAGKQVRIIIANK